MDQILLIALVDVCIIFLTHKSISNGLVYILVQVSFPFRLAAEASGQPGSKNDSWFGILYNKVSFKLVQIEFEEPLSALTNLNLAFNI